MDLPPDVRPDTRLAHGGGARDAATGGVTPPIHLATTFARDADYALVGPALYARADAPAFLPAEALLRDLEGGAEALLFASGMAAATVLLRTLRRGERVLAPRSMYHGLRSWLEGARAEGLLDVEFYEDGTAGIERGLAAEPARLVWVETPSNPTWQVTDVARAAELAHAAGAELVVDATVLTPLLMRPLALGADFVMHSATKLLNGHGDVVAGALVAGDAASERWRAVRARRHAEGAVLGAVEAWLLLRGMRTLHLRVARTSASALAVARRLARHHRVKRVLYPGLPDHPGHAIAAAQTSGGFGSMLSLLVDADLAGTRAVATRTRLFVPATSLGGTESLIEHRASVEPPGSPVPPELLRLSVGLEDPADLIADLEQALGA